MPMPFICKAILVDHEVVPVEGNSDEDLLAWARWYETANRHVAKTILNRRKHIWVSTVFLGMNHDYAGTDKGIWFETLVFGTSIDGAMDRYPDWESAMKGHAVMVGRARQARQVKDGRGTKAGRRRFRRDTRRFLKRSSNASFFKDNDGAPGTSGYNSFGVGSATTKET